MKKINSIPAIFFLLFSIVAPLSIANHVWNVSAASPLTPPTTPPISITPTLPRTPPVVPTVTPTKPPVCKTGVNSFAVSGYCRFGLVSSVKFSCYDGYTKTVRGFCAPVSYWQNYARVACASRRLCR